ncbi:MAG: thioredoxin family protein [Actinobacteria bacterium]|nr:thioredoxin family protein [Actinomycetota bacterium]
MDVTLLYFDGCPGWQVAAERLETLTDEYDFQLAYRKVETPEEAEELSFRGSPTVVVDGRDAFARGDEPVGLSCRLYETPNGQASAPTIEQLREVLDGR